MTIEQELRQALRRKAAPPDLAERVLARISARAAAPKPRQSAAPSMRRWLAAAAAVALLATGAVRYYEYQQTAAEAERVKQEIGLALQITSEKLALVQRRVQASTEESHR